MSVLLAVDLPESLLLMSWCSRDIRLLFWKKTLYAVGLPEKAGGQLPVGFAQIATRYGGSLRKSDTARFMNNVSLEGLALILSVSWDLNIDCDLKFGHLTAATRNKHIKALHHEADEWREIGHDDFTFLNKEETQSIVKSKEIYRLEAFCKGRK